MISFEIPGKCVAKERPRKNYKGNWYTPKATKDYEQEVRWWAKIAMKGRKPLTGEVKVKIGINEPIPPSWSEGKKAKALAGLINYAKSDLDNKIKNLLDGMNGIVYLDDSQVSIIEAQRQYGLKACALVSVLPVNDIK